MKKLTGYAPTIETTGPVDFNEAHDPDSGHDIENRPSSRVTKAKVHGNRVVKVKVQGVWVDADKVDVETKKPIQQGIRIELEGVVDAKVVHSAVESKPPALGNLNKFADFVPRGTRLQIKAMAGDYERDISEFRAAGRTITATWNVVLAWGTAVRYVFATPLNMLRDYIVGAFRVK